MNVPDRISLVVPNNFDGFMNDAGRALHPSRSLEEGELESTRVDDTGAGEPVGFTPNFIATQGQVMVNTGRSLFNTTDSVFFPGGRRVDPRNQDGSFLDETVLEAGEAEVPHDQLRILPEDIPVVGTTTVNEQDDTLYRDNVLRNRNEMNKQYDALHEELVSLISERDRCIHENMKVHQDMEWRTGELAKSNQLIKEEMSKNQGVLAEDKKRLSELAQANRKSFACKKQYEQDLERYSREWHKARDARNLQVEENEAVRTAIIEENEEWSQKKLETIAAVSILEVRRAELEAYLKTQEGMDPTEEDDHNPKDRDFSSGGQVKGDVYHTSQRSAQGGPSVTIDPNAYSSTESSVVSSYDTLNPFAGDTPSKYGAAPPPSGTDGRHTTSGSTHVDQKGGWYDYDNWGNLIFHHEEEVKKKQGNRGAGSNTQQTTSGTPATGEKPSGGWNGDVRTQHLYTEGGGWPDANCGGQQAPVTQGSSPSGGYPTGPRTNRGVNPTQGNHQGTKPLTRRSSMAPGLQQVYDADPSIRGLGLDSYSRGQDGTEVMNWSRNLSDQLCEGSSKGARRQARVTKPYKGRGPWKDEYQVFVDDCKYNGWSKEDSLGAFVIWLSDGPGKSAVSQWRTTYGSTGTYDQLETTSVYIFGNLVTVDHWLTFKGRTQKPKEPPKIFGLELQRILNQARPEWARDADYYIETLFVRFISGLSDPEHQEVTRRAWRTNSSLADLFLAIDSFEKKKILLAGMVPNHSRSSAVVDYGSSTASSEEESSGEEMIGAVAFNNKHREKTSDDKKRRKPFDKSGSNKKQDKNPGDKPNSQTTSKPQTTPSDSSNPQKVVTDQNALMEAMMKRMTALFDKPTNRTERPDLSTVTCYRCQEKGHYASSCTADKPVMRYAGKKSEN